MPRGGARPGAGRKSKPGPRPVVSTVLPKAQPPKADPGLNSMAVHKAAAVLVDYVPAEHIQMVNERLKGSPLEVVCALAEMPMPPNLTPEQERWERAFRLECRKVAMPYTHPRLVAVAHELAPPPSAKIGNYEKPVVEGEQGNDLEIARRIAFALAMGAAKAKQAA